MKKIIRIEAKGKAKATPQEIDLNAPGIDALRMPGKQEQELWRKGISYIALYLKLSQKKHRA